MSAFWTEDELWVNSTRPHFVSSEARIGHAEAPRCCSWVLVSQPWTAWEGSHRWTRIRSAALGCPWAGWCSAHSSSSPPCTAAPSFAPHSKIHRTSWCPVAGEATDYCLWACPSLRRQFRWICEFLSLGPLRQRTGSSPSGSIAGGCWRSHRIQFWGYLLWRWCGCATLLCWEWYS